MLEIVQVGISILHLFQSMFCIDSLLNSRRRLRKIIIEDEDMEVISNVFGRSLLVQVPCEELEVWTQPLNFIV